MLKARAVRIENLIRPVTDIPITGWFETDNHITGTVANPIVEGRFIYGMGLHMEKTYN